MCICLSNIHCQTAGPNRLKFGMWSLNTRVSIINDMCAAKSVIYHSHTHNSYLSCQKLTKGPMRLKFGMWSPSNRVSIDY